MRARCYNNKISPRATDIAATHGWKNGEGIRWADENHMQSPREPLRDKRETATGERREMNPDDPSLVTSSLPSSLERARRRVEDPADYDRLREGVRNGQYYSFVGAGPSEKEYPSWPRLVERLCQECGISINENLDDTDSDHLIRLAGKAKTNNNDAYKACLLREFGKSNPNIPSVVSRKCLCIVIGASRRSNRLWQPTLPV